MIDEQTYTAFFDELSAIGRQRMLLYTALPKEASLLGSVGRGFKMMATKPGGITSRLSKAWSGGVRAQAKRVGALKPAQGPVQSGASRGRSGVGEMNVWDRVSGGLKGVARSSTGKAVGATALGVGAVGGTGAALGRASAPQRH